MRYNDTNNNLIKQGFLLISVIFLGVTLSFFAKDENALTSKSYLYVFTAIFNSIQ